MRIAMVVVVGCSAPAHPVEPPAPAARLCDVAYWTDAAQSRQRAWLASAGAPHAHPASPRVTAHDFASAPMIVIETSDDDVRVATATAGSIVARWVPKTALGRAVLATTLARARPGERDDPAIRVQPGYPVPPTDGPWTPLGQGDRFGIAVTGVVPSELRGVIWTDEPVAEARGWWHANGVIRAAPAVDADIRATVTAAADLYAHGMVDGWFVVTARTRYLEVDGYLAKPPPRPPQGRYDFSEIEIEGELVEPPSPFAAGTCLYDAPHGNVVGMITGPRAIVRHQPAGAGWQRVVLTNAFGTTTYYTDAPVLAPPEPEPALDWSCGRTGC